MKFVIFVCKPPQKQRALDLLHKAHIDRVMCSDIDGHGISDPVTVVYRGEKHVVDHTNRVKFEMAVNDEDLSKIEEIAEQLGGGKLFVIPMDDVFHPSTKQHGREAV